MNTFGRIFRLTTFGESHGPAIGGIIDGVPPGMPLDTSLIQQELDKRRPGANPMTSARREADRVQILSGVMDGVTLGTPIGFVIPNTDARSADYSEMRSKYRPNHADFTYEAKYGVRDYRGGSRASARETACRVVGGAVALQCLASQGIEVSAFVSGIGERSRCSEHDDFAPLLEEVERAHREGDSVGGVVTCIVNGVAAGIGAPLFAKLHAGLGAAMLSIPGVKGFEYGDGFAASASRGTEQLDIFSADPSGRVITTTNHSGGIQGGIANGMPITMRIAFKPTPTLLRDLATIDTQGNATTLHARGRHDPCIALRGAAVVKAMAAMTLLDHLLLSQSTRL